MKTKENSVKKLTPVSLATSGLLIVEAAATGACFDMENAVNTGAGYWATANADTGYVYAHYSGTTPKISHWSRSDENGLIDSGQYWGSNFEKSLSRSACGYSSGDSLYVTVYEDLVTDKGVGNVWVD